MHAEKIIVGSFLAIWTAVIALELFAGYCERRSRRWKEWRSSVGYHLSQDNLGPFYPREPWFVRMAKRFESPRFALLTRRGVRF